MARVERTGTECLHPQFYSNDNVSFSYQFHCFVSEIKIHYVTPEGLEFAM